MQSVKDEWEHDQEADGTLDTLHVEYDPQRVNVEQMLQTVASQGYEGQLATPQDEPSEQ